MLIKKAGTDLFETWLELAHDMVKKTGVDKNELKAYINENRENIQKAGRHTIIEWLNLALLNPNNDDFDIEKELSPVPPISLTLPVPRTED